MEKTLQVTLVIKYFHIPSAREWTQFETIFAIIVILFIICSLLYGIYNSYQPSANNAAAAGGAGGVGGFASPKGAASPFSPHAGGNFNSNGNANFSSFNNNFSNTNNNNNNFSSGLTTPRQSPGVLTPKSAFHRLGSANRMPTMFRAPGSPNQD